MNNVPIHVIDHLRIAFRPLEITRSEKVIKSPRKTELAMTTRVALIRSWRGVQLTFFNSATTSIKNVLTFSNIINTQAR